MAIFLGGGGGGGVSVFRFWHKKICGLFIFVFFSDFSGFRLQ